MSSASNSPDNFFNDLSRPTGTRGRPQQTDIGVDGAKYIDFADGTDKVVPKPKKIACIICRKRKLKCDGNKPSCSTCTRLGHDCAYDEVRRKSGPKRGYVKALEERLKQVETLLKTQDTTSTSPKPVAPKFSNTVNGGQNAGTTSAPEFALPNASIGLLNDEQWRFDGESPQAPLEDMNFPADINMGIELGDPFTWEMIGLRLEEPLPLQETIDELHQIYFQKIHPSLPIIHKFRYLAAMNLAPSQRPPVALRYAMWTVAASITDKYMDLRDHFYQRARKYLELDYVKGHGEHMISVAHAQTHVILASYEFKLMYFPRAWMSTGSAVRLCQMMGLHRLDGAGLDVKQCLPPAKDWTEKEERRRTFWMAFAEDRYASIGTGWPMTIDEKDILTDLPASDEAFQNSKPEKTLTLTESMNPAGAGKLSSFGGVVLMACLFGRNLTHLHRPDSDDRDHDLNGEFWKRHRTLDNILLNTSLSMPSHLKLPNGLNDANIVFTNMNLHTSTICLHQAAIYKADKNSLPASIGVESKVRCITAAHEIASIMRMISHLDLSAMNPFMSFCLYVAARVFVQYLKSRPQDSQSADSLRFLLAAMNALKRKNPLTESFMVQLDVDLETLGMHNRQFKAIFAYNEDNLGLSSARMPNLGGASGHSPHNACYFMVMADEVVSPSDDALPVARDMTNNLSANSGAKIGIEQTRWSISDPAGGIAGQNIQRTMQGLALGSIPTRPDAEDMRNKEYSHSETDDQLSQNTGTGSDRPTPNSLSQSDLRANPKATANSGVTSYETSPASSHSARASASTDAHSMSALFPSQQDHSSISSTGLTPDGNTFAMPEMLGRDFQPPPGWEMSGQTGGLTPIGQGVFNQLMGIGPLDSMDLVWEGET